MKRRFETLTLRFHILRMKTLFVVLLHITNLESKKIPNKLTPVPSCPMNEPDWRKKSQQFSCSDDMTYHCILAKNESAYELCIHPNAVSQKDGCPQINFYEDQILFDSSTSECPFGNKDCPKGNETYRTDALYLFNACLQKISVRKHSVKETKQTNGDASTFSTNPQEKDTTALIAVIIIAFIIIIALVIILLYTQKTRLGICCSNLCRKNAGRYGIDGSAACNTDTVENTNEPELETLVKDKDNENSSMFESQSAHQNANEGINGSAACKTDIVEIQNEQGRTTNRKVGGIFDLTFNVKGSGNEIMLKKDGKEVTDGRRTIKSEMQDGYRLVILQLIKEDEGMYTCSNTETGEADTVRLTITRDTKAIYHNECTMSLMSIPSILFSIQQASRHAFQTNETPVSSAVEDLRSSLDKVKREAFRVLTLSYDKIKQIQMLALQIEAVYLHVIIEALKNKWNVDIIGKLSKMARDIEEGQKIIKETLHEMRTVKGFIEEVELKFAATLPSLSEDMTLCHKSLKNLFAKWTAYESFFSSLNFVISKGTSLTKDQAKAVEEHTDVLLPYDIEVLWIYVSSVKCSTSYYLEIYLGEIQQLVDDFYVDEHLDEDAIGILRERIRKQYEEKYEAGGRTTETPAISYK